MDVYYTPNNNNYSYLISNEIGEILIKGSQRP